MPMGSSSNGNLLRLFFGLSVTCLSFLTATPAWSQSSSTGTVLGQVTDQSSAAVPGAVIKLTEKSTNKTYTSTSNDAGRYTFVSVPPGVYDVMFSRSGFSVYTVKAQTVEVGNSLTINAPLAVGSTSTTVEVNE